jgi:hypothetical protein
MLVLQEHLSPSKTLPPMNWTKKRTTGVGYGMTNAGGTTGSQREETTEE